jgi:hypothetical protein
MKLILLQIFFNLLSLTYNLINKNSDLKTVTFCCHILRKNEFYTTQKALTVSLSKANGQ